MKQKDQGIDDEALIELIRIIGKPTLEFMLKRIQNKIIEDKTNSSMPVNSFLSIMIGALSIINASILIWISESTEKRIGVAIDLDNLLRALIENIKNQLGTKERDNA